jgi:hypothetical protein
VTDLKLTPEAFGTLLAMKKVSKLRFFDPQVAGELTGKGLARSDADTLSITDAGKAVRQKFKASRKLIKRGKAASRKRPPVKGAVKAARQKAAG